MIEIITAKEFTNLWNKLQELNERTKKHTKDIQELKKQIEERE